MFKSDMLKLKKSNPKCRIVKFLSNSYIVIINDKIHF